MVGAGVLLGARWLSLRLRGYDGPVYWWIWWAVAAFAVVVCASLPLLSVKLGARGAARLLAVVGVLVIAGMLVAVWWSLQSKNGI
jgi:hypothetical protein